jgi:hypothetical protein
VGSSTGLDDVERNNVSHTGTRTASLDRSARIQSLYRLSYPGSYMYTYTHEIIKYNFSFFHFRWCPTDGVLNLPISQMMVYESFSVAVPLVLK